MRWAALILLLVAGCGAEIGNAAGRRVSARETCHSVGYNDVIVDSSFDAYRIDRDAGFAEPFSATNVFPACRGEFGAGCPENPGVIRGFISFNQCVFNCASCTMAVIREVYAE